MLARDWMASAVMVSAFDSPEITEEGLFRVMAELDSTGLEAGEYELRVSQRDGAGSATVESSRRFRVR